MTEAAHGFFERLGRVDTPPRAAVAGPIGPVIQVRLPQGAPQGAGFVQLSFGEGEELDGVDGAGDLEDSVIHRHDRAQPHFDPDSDQRPL